jgi:hypothetical protein
MATDTNTPIPETFPQDIEVPLVLKFQVSNSEQKEYFLHPETKAVDIQFIADLFDVMQDNFYNSPIQINNLTCEQIRVIFRQQP